MQFFSDLLNFVYLGVISVPKITGYLSSYGSAARVSTMDAPGCRLSPGGVGARAGLKTLHFWRASYLRGHGLHILSLIHHLKLIYAVYAIRRSLGRACHPVNERAHGPAAVGLNLYVFAHILKQGAQALEGLQGGRLR